MHNNTETKNEHSNKIVSNNYGIFNSKALISISDEFSQNRDTLSYEHLLANDIVLCIDHSGSMAGLVEAKDSNGNKLENGFTQQDIVNHAVRTVAKSLTGRDRLSIIIFDNQIEILFELLPMNTVNIENCMDKIKNVQPRGQTNIWSAIEKAYEILEKRDDKTRNTAIMLLTDGIPNVSPARGEVETLKRKKKAGNYSTPLYTFGFGYNLQNGLLYDMAKYGNGLTGHIPDGGMIATVFSNFLGNIQSTIANNVKLIIESVNDTIINDLEPVMGEYIVEKMHNQKYMIYINSLQIQQTRHIVINFDRLPRNKNVVCAKYYLEYNIGDSTITTNNCDYYHNETTEYDTFNNHIIRYQIVEYIRKAINSKYINSNVDDILDIMNNLTKDSPDDYVKNIHETIQEQVNIALSNNPEHVTMHNGCNVSYFKKWGEFYLDQLSLALNNEFKPNFKDKACFQFGGEIFNDFVDKCSDIFDTLPPPQPSALNNHYNSYGGTSVYRGLGGNHSIHTTQPIASLASYNDPHGGCFHSDCLITMSDKTKKMLKEIKKGDEIMTLKHHNDINSITYTKVLCVYETIMQNRKCNLVTLENNLKITEWHPILTPLGWKFPSEFKNANMENCDSIITLVLEDYHVAFINEHPCITLAHNFKDSILKHDFYGTNKVIESLSVMPGYEDGHIKNNSGNVIRNIHGEVINIEYM